MIIPSNTQNAIKQAEYRGCVKFANDIAEAKDKAGALGTLTIKGQETTLHSWDKSLRDLHVTSLRGHEIKQGIYIMAVIVSGIAAAILMPHALVASTVLGGVAFLSVGGMLYQRAKRLKELSGFGEQAALDAQYYLAYGPVEAMKRKWQQDRLNSLNDLDFLLVNEQADKNKYDEFNAAIKTASKLSQHKDEANIKELRDLLAPQQAIFDKLKAANGVPDRLTDIVLKWFQGDRNDPEVLKFSQMQE